MADEQRSPFGELVRMHRRRLSLSQLDLATLAKARSELELEGGTVSERTVAAYERKAGDPRQWAFPRPSTVRALAQAFGLGPGSPEYAEFLQAAQERPGSVRESASTPSSRRSIVRKHAVGRKRFFAPAGREPHIVRLQRAVDDIVVGIPGVVLVSADSGGGKTSLIEEICRRALANSGDLVVLWGECTDRSGAADPYQPFRQALGVLAGDTAAAAPRQLISIDNEQRIATRTLAAIRALVAVGDGLIDRLVSGDTLHLQIETGRLDAATAARLESLLDASGGSRPSARGLHEQVFRVLAQYATEGPIILVLEDLHLADSGTTSLLFHVMRRLREHNLPILVLGSFRPAHLGADHPGERHPFAPILHEAPRLFDDTLLDLSNAVGGDAGRSFVDAVVAEAIDDAPISLCESLFEQTAGVPLFVVNMLRWYQVMGSIRTAPDGVVSFRHVAAPGLLPAEIDALFANLIDRLPHDLQTLLEVASIQGTTFSAEVVMRVMGLSHELLIDMIDYQLTRRFRLLVAGGVSTIGRHRGHDIQFAHALLRDYLYHRMSDLQRDHYHAVTAEAMRALYGSGQHNGAGRIAFHFDEAGEHVESAAPYLMAGDYAMGLSDFEQATRFFERIGELDLRAVDPFRVAQALVGLGNCARVEGDTLRADRLFEQALDLAEREGLLLVKANSLTSMSMLDFDAGRMSDGAVRLEAAIQILDELGNLDEACCSLTLLSHVLYGMGSYDDAATAARRAIETGTQLRSDMLVVGGMIALANCRVDIGLFSEATTMYRRCIDICDEHGSVPPSVICRLNIALCEIEQEFLDRASSTLEIMFTSQQKVTSHLLGAAKFNAALVAEGQANWAKAKERYRTSLDIRLENGQDALVVDSLAGLLRVAIAEGRHQNVRDITSDLASRIDTRGLDGVEHSGRLFVSMITAHLTLGHKDCARSYTQRAVAVLNHRAGRLADPIHRESYLSKVPSHRLIFALALSLGVEIHNPRNDPSDQGTRDCSGLSLQCR